MLLAFQLLDKYKKDNQFIKKDITKMKKNTSTLIQDPADPATDASNSAAAKSHSKTALLDPTLTQEERHRIIAEKRQKRK